jgi:hypothetical protein
VTAVAAEVATAVAEVLLALLVVFVIGAQLVACWKDGKPLPRTRNRTGRRWNRGTSAE